MPMRETLKVMANVRDLEVAPVALGDKGMAVRKFLDDPAHARRAANLLWR